MRLTGKPAAVLISMLLITSSFAGCSADPEQTVTASGTVSDTVTASTDAPEQGIAVPEGYDVDNRFYRSETAVLDYGGRGHVANIFAAGDEVCIEIFPHTEAPAEEKLFFTDRRGGDLREITVGACMYQIVWSEDHLIGYSNLNEILIIDPETGAIEQSIPVSDPPGFYGMPVLGAVPGGYVLLFGGVIVRYDIDGNETGRIESDELPSENYLYKCPVKVVNGITYAIEDDMPTIRYWRLDFDNGTAELASAQTSYTGVGLMMSGIYCFYNDSVEYTVYDPQQQSFITVAERSNMLIEPSGGTEIVYQYPYPIDEDLIVIPHSYSDEGAHLTYVFRDPDLDLSGREEITIGGFDIMRDAAVERAVYEYNSHQDEYIIRLSDFSDLYPAHGTPPQSEINRQADMIRDFNNGNAPDIFYGDTFDYNYWGQAGMVADISDYIDLDSANVTPSIRALMQNGDGSIYRIFSSYTIMGYFGRSSIFGNRDGYSVFDIPAPSEGQTIEGDIHSADIVYYALVYNLSSGLPDSGTMNRLVSLAIERGTDPSSPVNTFSDPEGVGNGSFLMCNSNISSGADYRDLAEEFGELPSYIGYPSYNGSSHPIRPAGLMAVSSGARDIEACCEFMSYILTDEAQYTLLTCGFPVNDDILNIYLDALTDRSTIPDGMAVYLAPSLTRIDYNTGNTVPVTVSPEEADGLRSAIDNIDSINTMDFGVWDIVLGEMTSHYTQDLPASNIADDLISRIGIYISENGL